MTVTVDGTIGGGCDRRTGTSPIFGRAGLPASLTHPPALNGTHAAAVAGHLGGRTPLC